MRVAYSSNARFVRYGSRAKKISADNIQKNGTDEGASTNAIDREMDGGNLDIRYELDGLSLRLRRDDKVEGLDDMSVAQQFNYDIVLLRVQLVEVSVKTNASGDTSFHLSLFRIGLFDLGDSGRLVREQFLTSLPTKRSQMKRYGGLRLPCPFSVLAEGYAPDEDKDDSPENIPSTDGPQLVITVDRCPISSVGSIGSLTESELPDDTKVTVARVVINYLSVNALVRPFQEVVAFLSCGWPSATVRLQTLENTEALMKNKGKEEISYPSSGTSSINRVFQLKLVAHYPRVFFLADESDPHSRALVLRG